jgi:hypothetical protein
VEQSAEDPTIQLIGLDRLYYGCLSGWIRNPRTHSDPRQGQHHGSPGSFRIKEARNETRVWI